jgi:hypothetical protein
MVDLAAIHLCPLLLRRQAMKDGKIIRQPTIVSAPVHHSRCGWTGSRRGADLATVNQISDGLIEVV